jgi:hypothetical protein
MILFIAALMIGWKIGELVAHVTRPELDEWARLL